MNWQGLLLVPTILEILTAIVVVALALGWLRASIRWLIVAIAATTSQSSSPRQRR
ncbi:hypothetical protein OJ997_26505 [Solirubrobacter phytolaccae]|uniref:Uncharacterized protein n=1 Tax=Solirubrobacter phytolaccae TaxID=1404360 RepID=A0A9X3ND36_9ACTN|nr:hypothetical protein [Solirubrobacter phytolaccae]MDA0183886.1 hypothetical protein [Solirubrobacter phytolaccae]